MLARLRGRPTERDIPSGAHLIFVPFIGAFGGVERLILGMARHLHELDTPHVIICFGDTIDFSSYADWPLHVLVVKARRNTLAEGMALRHVLTSTRTRISGPILVFDLKGALYAWLAGYPFVLHLTDPPSLLGSDISKYAISRRATPATGEKSRSAAFLLRAEAVHRATRAAVDRAACVIVMSRRIQEEVDRVYGVSSMILRPGVRHPAAALGNDAAPPLPELHILSVSRLEASKRIDWILVALAELEMSSSPLSVRFDWTLDIVGEGTRKEDLQQCVDELRLDGRVQFHGAVSDARLEQLYQTARLFLMPAVQGWGLPALESLERGIPVVLHGQSGVSEILSESDWVEVIRAPDGSDLGAAIERMLSRVQHGLLRSESRPRVPSETDWARAIAEKCEWL